MGWQVGFGQCSVTFSCPGLRLKCTFSWCVCLVPFQQCKVPKVCPEARTLHPPLSGTFSSGTDLCYLTRRARPCFQGDSKWSQRPVAKEWPVALPWEQVAFPGVQGVGDLCNAGGKHRSERKGDERARCHPEGVLAPPRGSRGSPTPERPPLQEAC